MKACTRCGLWHTDAESASGKRLSCTDVKKYWARIRSEHRSLYGHTVQITTDEAGNWICFACKRRLLQE
jgi:hypothetical protein